MTSQEDTFIIIGNRCCLEVDGQREREINREKERERERERET